jgi:hypothetical protein
LQVPVVSQPRIVSRPSTTIQEHRDSIDANRQAVATEVERLHRELKLLDTPPTLSPPLEEQLAIFSETLRDIGIYAEQRHAALEATQYELTELRARVNAWETRWSMLIASWRWSRALQIALGVGILAAGEFFALVTLANGQFHTSPRLAFGAIGYAFAAIPVSAMLGSGSQSDAT